MRPLRYHPCWLAALLACFAASLAPVGCGTAISEGIATYRGGVGKVLGVEPQDAKRIDTSRFDAIKVGPIVDHAPQLTDPRFHSELDRALAKRLGVDPRFNANGQRALVITGEIIHYDAGGGLGKYVSPYQEVVIRTTLTEQPGDKPIAKAHIVGKCSSRIRTGPDELADGVAKGIAHWLNIEESEEKD